MADAPVYLINLINALFSSLVFATTFPRGTRHRH